MKAQIGVREIEAAAARIRPYIRRTPLLELRTTLRAPLPWDVVLKLESLQVTGSFKPRGALNALLSLPRSEIQGGVVTASGGNHGLGVAYAARTLGVPALAVRLVALAVAVAVTPLALIAYAGLAVAMPRDDGRALLAGEPEDRRETIVGIALIGVGLIMYSPR